MRGGDTHLKSKNINDKLCLVDTSMKYYLPSKHGRRNIVSKICNPLNV
jgi:hypothetical protein